MRWIRSLFPIIVLIISSALLRGRTGPPALAPADSSDTRRAPQADPLPITFAAIGDYGDNSNDESRVSNLVKGWNPDFILTLGDNNYNSGSERTIDRNIGKYFSEYIGNYRGGYGPGSTGNRFWPTLGNHDWNTPGAKPYLDYFTLPGNERYYQVRFPFVHLFALDSNGEEPDGITADSIQANWLKESLSASTACHKIVYMHHPPYSSGQTPSHGSQPDLQWPFAAWGADAVLAAHDHFYERLAADGIPFFVNGLGGKSIYEFMQSPDLPPGVVSKFKYNAQYGAMKIVVNKDGILYEFYNVDREQIDSLYVAKECPLLVDFLPIVGKNGP